MWPSYPCKDRMGVSLKVVFMRESCYLNHSRLVELGAVLEVKVIFGTPSPEPIAHSSEPSKRV